MHLFFYFIFFALRNLDVVNFVEISVETAPKGKILNIVKTVHFCEHFCNSGGKVIVSRIQIRQVITPANVYWQFLIEVDTISSRSGVVRKHFFQDGKPLIRSQVILYHHYKLKTDELLNTRNWSTGDIKETKSEISTNSLVCNCSAI